MKQNVGNVDKLIRLLCALVIFIFAFITNSLWILIIGLIPLLTSLIGFCPLYLPFGINTKKPKK
jgi:hypothetical protein